MSGERVINILAVGNVPPVEMKIIKEELEKIFAYDFNIYARVPMPQECYIENRGQYDAPCVLNSLLRYPGYRVVGIVSEDLTVENFNFVFGLASFDGRGCVISTYRLRHKNKKRYFERVKKEIMHELGHTFGLKHCKNKCVMQFSNTVFDTDIKPARFCNECTEKIKEHLR